MMPRPSQDGVRPPAPVAPQIGGGREKRPRNSRKRARTGLGLVAARAVTSLFALAGVLVVGGGIAGYAVFHRYTADLPTVDGLRTYQPPVMSRVYAANASSWRSSPPSAASSCPSPPSPTGEAGLHLGRGPELLDPPRRRSRRHPARRGDRYRRYGHGRRPIGASTITQQVAKNMLLQQRRHRWRARSRKRSSPCASSSALTKERILELYLNEIYLGVGSLWRGRGGRGPISTSRSTS